MNDVQNTPPIFQGSLAAVIDEDSPIGTLVMTIQARDGDRGQPRKIAYDLITSNKISFVVNSVSNFRTKILRPEICRSNGLFPTE